MGGFRKLLPAQTAEELQLDKIKKKWDRIQGRDPSKSGGRQMLVSDLYAISARWQREGKRQNDQARHSKVINGHAKIFARLSRQ